MYAEIPFSTLVLYEQDVQREREWNLVLHVHRSEHELAAHPT